MKDILGIKEVIDVLEPHWPAIENDFNRHNARYLELSGIDHDAIGRILRAHLVVENFINSFLQEFYGFEQIDDLRLSFAQKAKLLPAGKSSAALVRPGIIQINAVRNKFGHRLNHSVQFGEISSVMQVLEVARAGSKFETPIHAIEAFVPIACAFLSIPPKHLQQIFAEAFSHIHSLTPSLS